MYNHSIIYSIDKFSNEGVELRGGGGSVLVLKKPGFGWIKYCKSVNVFSVCNYIKKKKKKNSLIII